MAIKIKNKKVPVSPEVTFFFLSSVLQKAENFARHIDNQTNIIVGLSSGLAILSASQIKKENIDFIAPLLILAIFSLFAASIGIFALIPPKFMRKKGQKESLLYNREIARCYCEQYKKDLKDISLDLNKITDQYSLEIYNICRYYYRPKRRLFKFARLFLCLGILISFAILITELLLINF